jgi:hypothetical protein
MPEGRSALSSTRGIAPRPPESNVVPTPVGERSPGTNAVLRRFNRDTTRVVVWLLGVVFFAAFAFAVLIPEPHPAVATDTAKLLKIVDSSAKISLSQVTSGTLTQVDQVSAESSLKERPAPVEVAEKTTAALSAPVVVTGCSPDIDRVNQKEIRRAVSGKVPYRRGKSPGKLSDAEVKKRLIELWHQSLTRTQKPRSWAAYSQWARRKKVAFTARK